jgi:hypothetical protein
MHSRIGPIIEILKPMHTATQNKQTDSRKYRKLLKPRRLRTKDERKRDRKPETHTRRSWHPRGPAIRITVYMRPRSFASPARTHATHETKTKTKRSRSPGYGGRTSRSNSPKPPMLFAFLLRGKEVAPGIVHP